MDKISLIDSDGNLYNSEPPNLSLDLVYDQTSNHSTSIAPRIKRLNRVSSANWCFWAISSDFEVNLYVHSSKHPISAVVGTYGHQGN